VGLEIRPKLISAVINRVAEKMDQRTNVDRVPEDIARAVLDPRAYGQWHELHHKLATLRREHPFAPADLEGYDPFWIAAKFADIQEIALRSDVFLSGLGPMQSRDELKINSGSSAMFRSIVAMNSPEARRQGRQGHPLLSIRRS
jgi:hypothetical protein